MTHKPCPFCGSNELRMYSNLHPSPAYVYCEDCGADGPSSEGGIEDEAWALWDARQSAE